MTTPVDAPTSPDATPVAEDLSGWFLCGRIHDDDSRSGMDAAVEAERIGYRRVFLSERANLKEAGAVLGGIAARTERLGIGTGVIGVRSRHPVMTAALGATLHAAYGPRFTLGIGRSEASFFPGAPQCSYEELVDYVGIVRRLWAGERVDYTGPAGTYTGISLLGDVYHGPAPEVWIGALCAPKGAAAAAAAFDGVLLWPYLTLDAAAEVVANIHQACERIDRDPASIRICLPIVTAPELDEMETRLIAYARLITYLTWPPNNMAYFRINKSWDLAALDRIMAHPLIAGLKDSVADLTFHREDLIEVMDLIPAQWVEETCALGSVDHCVEFMQSYRDLGIDEIATYGSSPTQNEALVKAWMQRAR